MVDTIIFEISTEDAYGRRSIKTKHSYYSKYNDIARNDRETFIVMNHIADQMNNREGMGCAFTVEGM